MKIFIDTADVEAIRRAKAMGFVSGVTTNPSLIAAEGKDFHTVIKEIASIVDGPVSAEVLSETAEEMIAEGQVLAGLDPHVVVKIPMTGEGMKAVSALSDMGIRSNVTLIFSAGQALLAALAGRHLVTPALAETVTATPGLATRLPDQFAAYLAFVLTGNRRRSRALRRLATSSFYGLCLRRLREVWSDA